MSRTEQLDQVSPVLKADPDPDLALWLRMGRAAFFFCLWAAMAIPVLLVISARLAG